jgi:hypothetical protein
VASLETVERRVEKVVGKATISGEISVHLRFEGMGRGFEGMIIAALRLGCSVRGERIIAVLGTIMMTTGRVATVTGSKFLFAEEPMRVFTMAKEEAAVDTEVEATSTATTIGATTRGVEKVGGPNRGIRSGTNLKVGTAALPLIGTIMALIMIRNGEERPSINGIINEGADHK